VGSVIVVVDSVVFDDDLRFEQRIEVIAPMWVPTPVSRFFFRFVGTRSPSSRHSRRTRLLLTA